MRILFLTGQVPYPPQAGGALRTYGLLDGLHHAGHTLDLLTFYEPGQPEPSSTPLATLCNQIHSVPAPVRPTSARLRDILLSNHAVMARRFYSSQYAAALNTMLIHTNYKLVQIKSLEMAAYLPIVRLHR